MEKSFEALMGVTKFNRSVLKASGAPVRFPDFKLTDKIYVNTDGLYWHTRRPRGYHRDLRMLFEAEGLRLYQFYEDEVRDKPHAVKAILDVALGKVGRRLGARSMEVVDVADKDARAFLAHHHLIGAPSLCRHLGLRLGDELLCVASYKNAPASVELIRLCTAGGVIVNGGATRLLRELQRRHPSRAITTLVDHRYASTENWERWGFVKTTERLGYQYTDGHMRMDKRRFRVPAGTDERASALARGWHRIYDAGKSTLWLAPEVRAGVESHL